MKKAVLFEPELLAEVERKSPDLYEYYCNSPLSKMEFVDYGNEGNRCLIKKEIMDTLELIAEYGQNDLSKKITASQTGCRFGVIDLKKKLPEDQDEHMVAHALLLITYDLILNYTSYEIESLLDIKNYGKRNGLLYNKLTYREAQYYMAWEYLMKYHMDFNGVFVEINFIQKLHKLKINAIMCSGAAYN